SAGYRAEYRRRTSRTVSPEATGSSTTWDPLPSPPTSLVTHVVTSTVALSRLATFVPSPAMAGEPPLAPDVPREPAAPEVLAHLPLRLAGLPIVADRLVPDVQHVIPLLHDGLILGRAIDGLGSISLRRVLHVGPDPAPEVERAQDRRRPPPEPHGLVEAIVPA